MKHPYQLFITAVATCDCCESEITEYCAECPKTVCESCHDNYSEEDATWKTEDADIAER